TVLNLPTVSQTTFAGPGYGTLRRQKRLKSSYGLPSTMPSQLERCSHIVGCFKFMLARGVIEEETTLHCLRDCEFVKHLWKTIGFTVWLMRWFHNSLSRVVLGLRPSVNEVFLQTEFKLRKQASAMECSR
ncbi:hypothetical protein A2U01_0054638, partial [Trifolium medium]|nr:hypothetical protein [Trifolium medium]